MRKGRQVFDWLFVQRLRGVDCAHSYPQPDSCVSNSEKRRGGARVNGLGNQGQVMAAPGCRPVAAVQGVWCGSGWKNGPFGAAWNRLCTLERARRPAKNGCK